MSRIIYTCSRDPSQGPATVRRLLAIGERLQPDNLVGDPPQIVSSGGIAACIIGPGDLVAVRGSSLAAGHLIDAGAWERPRSRVPDGAYALFRSDEAVVEIATDMVASRTVWYALTDQLFVAATSQRAIVALLSKFEFNPAVIPWMLANGTLGPGLSWDKRIHCVQGATSLVLDRKAWSLRAHTEPVHFAPDPASASEQRQLVVSALRQAIGAARVADPQWAIALSGGVDCRVILCCLKDTHNLRAVTWGLQASCRDKSNDAYIAPLLARHFGLDHRYLETDISSEPLDRVFERFIAIGEGRVDHISGYADGFELWRKLVQSGVRGMVRGDEAFGKPAVRNSIEVRTVNGVLAWSDIPDLLPLDHFDLPQLERPDWMEQRSAESLEAWRDRIYQQYRVPYCLAALSDLKLPYVEVINPLLSGSLVQMVRRLPDELRTDKRLLRQIAQELSPRIPFARSAAIQPGDDIFRTQQAVELLRDSLSGNGAGAAVPEKLASYAVNRLAEMPRRPRPGVGSRLRRAIKSRTPAWALPRRIERIPPPSVNGHRLAFRTFLVSRMTRLLSDDATCLR